jgi:bacterioferritin
MNEFVTDVKLLRERARQNMLNGAVTENYKANRNQVIQVLNDVQLNGQPNFSPDGLATRSHSEYVEGNDLISMIREDLVAERIAVESYTEIIRWLDDSDPTSRKLIEDILKTEEEHAEDMKSLLERMG